MRTAEGEMAAVMEAAFRAEREDKSAPAIRRDFGELISAIRSVESLMKGKV